MFRSLSDFEFIWSGEIERTQKILKHLTNRSLAQAVNAEGRTLGRLAWHITTSIPEMMERTGLKIPSVDQDAPVPATAKEIFSAYNAAAIGLLDQIKAHWTDETLKVKDDMYGDQWTRAFTLQVLVFHQIHHRGQMTVLMRQAGLELPGIFGPARQEWEQMGMQPPEI